MNIGRKNYYFAGSHEGGRWAAALYSLLGTCKLQNVNPWEYLRDVMVRVNLLDGGTARELLPMYYNGFTRLPNRLQSYSTPASKAGAARLHPHPLIATECATG